MKKIQRPLLVSLSLSASVLSATAETVLSGDHVIEHTSTQAGSLTVEGNLHVEGAATDLGTTGTGLVAVQMSYTESGTVYDYVTLATRDAVQYWWKQNGVGTAKAKMKLNAANALTLFDTSGSAKITLDPSGTSTLAGSLVGSGTDNRLPNQTLTGAGSILTQGLGDGRYVQNVGSYGNPNSVGLTGAQAGGNYAFAVADSYANSSYSVALSGGMTEGDHATALSGGGAWANYSTAMSSGSAGGESSTAMGWGSAGGFASTAMSGGTAEGDFSTAIGVNAWAQGYSQVALGRYNIVQGSPTAWVATDDLFTVGNGTTDTAPSNAFVIKKNGNMWVGGDSTLTGKVGIGTSATPTAKLEVVGDVKITGGLNATATLTAPSVTLPDGSTLTTARTTTLYNSAGSAVASVTGDGKVNFINGLSVGSNPAATLTPNSTVYMKNLLGNFGFEENPVAATSVTAIVFGSNFRYYDGMQMTSDSAGNSYIAGAFEGGTLAVGKSSVWNAFAPSSAGFIVKLGADGQIIWSKTIQAGRGVSSMIVDGGGNVYVAGYVQHPAGQSVNVGGIALSHAAAIEGWEAYVIKLNNMGEAQWARSVFDKYGNSMKLNVDGNGAVYISGTSNYMAGQNVNIAGVTLAAKGAQDGYVVKLSGAGVAQWGYFLGSSYADSVTSLSVDGSNSVYLAGNLTGTATQTLSVAGMNVTSAGGVDGYIIKLDGAGTGQWARMLGSTGSDSVRSFLLDAVGAPLIGGTFNRTAGATVNIAGTNVTANGGDDGYVAKLTSDGAVQWTQILGADAADSVDDLYVDNGGYIYVSGGFVKPTGQTMNLAGSTVTALSNQNVYVLKMNSSGVGQWAKSLGSNYLNSMTAAPDGGVLVTGNIYTQPGQSVTLAGLSSSAGDFGSTNYMLKLSPAGAGQWLKLIYGSVMQIKAIPAGIALTGDGYGGNIRWGDQIVPGAPFFIKWNGSDLVTPASSVPAALEWGGAQVTGQSGIAFGANSVAAGIGAVTLGKETASWGENSFSAGYATSALGKSATSFGSYSKAIGDSSFAAGGGAIAYGVGSVAFGFQSNAYGTGSFSAGGWEWGNSALGDGAFVIGDGNYAAGNYSFATGHWTVASKDFSVAMGETVTAAAYGAVAIGDNLTASAINTFVIGRLNVPQGNPDAWTPADDLFVIGNGDKETAWEPSNAFVVHKNGNVRAAGDVDVKGTIRVKASGDIGMGGFTAGPNPADATNGLDAGLRYPGE